MRHVPIAPARRARAPAAASQRQMWAVGMIFPGDPECMRGRVDRCRQITQLRNRLDAHPEHARCLGGWEESVAPKDDFKLARLYASQCSLDVVHRLRRLLANELQSHMQRFRPNPPRIRSKAANAFHESLNPLSDLVVNVESNEDSHSAVSHTSWKGFNRKDREK